MTQSQNSFSRNITVVFGLAVLFVVLGLALRLYRDHSFSPKSQIQQTDDARARLKTAQAEENQIIVPNDQPVSVEEMQTIVSEKKAIVLDARPVLFYKLGHLPGSLSLPREGFEKGYSTFAKTLEPNKNKLIVVYCSDNSCDDSEVVAQKLLSLGYTQVRVFKGGWDLWTQDPLRHKEKNE